MRKIGREGERGNPVTEKYRKGERERETGRDRGWKRCREGRRERGTPSVKNIGGKEEKEEVMKGRRK